MSRCSGQPCLVFGALQVNRGWLGCSRMCGGRYHCVRCHLYAQLQVTQPNWGWLADGLIDGFWSFIFDEIRSQLLRGRPPRPYDRSVTPIPDRFFFPSFCKPWRNMAIAKDSSRHQLHCRRDIPGLWPGELHTGDLHLQRSGLCAAVCDLLSRLVRCVLDGSGCDLVETS